MNSVEFEALDHLADGGFMTAHYRFQGDCASGWRIERDGSEHLRLGPGYRVLRVRSCGVCATDLARRFLPFPLPQVIGHEVLAQDENGRRCVIEINASCAARGLSERCGFCANGLDTHCPDRMVLGIDRLPGGFGPWVIAPRGAVFEVPDEISSDTAVLAEPLAAALNAVDRVSPRDGDTVAVFGPRRLGMLVIACLAARREEHGRDFRIRAVTRRDDLAARARAVGADEVRQVEREGPGEAEVVIDTTGNPEAFEVAIGMARRELHLKSTHGRPAAGLHHLTELVVDEMSIVSADDESASSSSSLRPSTDPVIGNCSGHELPFARDGRARLEVAASPEDLSTRLATEALAAPLMRADIVVVGSDEQLDRAIRPGNRDEVSPLRPRGTLALLESSGSGASFKSPLSRAILDRGLTLSTSRCGDFRSALELLASQPALRDLGERMVTHRFKPEDVAEAFRVAASTACVKAVVDSMQPVI